MQPSTKHYINFAISLLMTLGPASVTLTQSGIPTLMKAGLLLGGTIAFATTVKAAFLPALGGGQ